MIGVGREGGVMPEQAQVAMMRLDFGDESLAEEIGFILAEVHISGIAERAVHDGEWMES